MKIYVGNIPHAASEADIQDWFANAGFAGVQIALIRDRFSGEPRGFGFIEIEDSSQAEALIRSCNGAQMMGRALVVNEARPMREGGGRGFGGGRSGGGGNRGGGGGGRGPRRGRW